METFPLFALLITLAITARTLTDRKIKGVNRKIAVILAQTTIALLAMGAAMLALMLMVKQIGH